jgi:predicted DNA-binding transcriptional regulator YafY
LDRIVSIEPYEDKPFVENTFFDPEHYFDNIVGVTKDLKSQAQTVKLKVDANQAPYVITKPLHGSQKVLKKLEDGGIVVTIEVVPNQELERIILGFGQHMQVIEPRLLRHRMKKELQVAALQYEMVK